MSHNLDITAKHVADVLFNVATILELAEDNPYRVRSYRRAARLMLRQEHEIKSYLDANNELAIPGLGPALRKKLGQLVTTGKLAYYIELFSPPAPPPTPPPHHHPARATSACTDPR